MEKEIFEYLTVYDDGVGEILEKKSRFIASVHCAESEEEAISFINLLEKKYWDAKHNCYAYVIGKEANIVRCSDDGEPSGTAGKPILEVLLKEELINVVVVVTRYFGGVLLGTGGLVRAYTQATQEGIRNSKICTMQFVKGLVLHTDYNGIGKIKHCLAKSEIQILKEEYKEDVELKIAVLMLQKDSLCKELIEATNGRIKMEEKDTFYLPKT